MSYSEAFIRAIQRIREQERDARIEMKDSITPSRIAWHVYRDTKGYNSLYGLENCSKKDIEEAKAKLAVRQPDLKDYSDYFLTSYPINFQADFPGPDSTAPKPISCISRPTLHWIEIAQPMSLLAQCSQPIVSEGHRQMISKNLRWSSHKLLFVPGSIECLEKEIINLITSREGLPIPLEDLPDLYFRTYGSLLAIDGYKSQYGEPYGTPCCLNEALGSKMNSIKLHDSKESPLQTILLKDPAIVIPNRIHIICSSNANFRDIQAHFKKFDKHAILLHPEPIGQETHGSIICYSPDFANDILSTTPHKVGNYEVRVHHYLKQPNPSAFRCRGPGFDLMPVVVRALGSSKFHYVMGYEEAYYMQFFEDEDHRRSINLPPRDERWFSGPNVEDLPDSPFDIDYREDSSSIQQWHRNL